jgi:hypothetical protein
MDETLRNSKAIGNLGGHGRSVDQLLNRCRQAPCYQAVDIWPDLGRQGCQKMFNEHGHTSASLLEAAMSKRKDELIKLDQQIALRMKRLM